MAKEIFLLTYMVFMGMLIFLISLGAPQIVGEKFANKISPPSCSIGGLDALVDIVICIADNIGIFFQLMSISTPIKILGIVLFTPFLIVLFYIILTLIRGGG